MTAERAYALGEKSFTSTLLTSPKKSLRQLQIAGDRLGEKFGIQFIAPDYRKASGTQEQNILAKEASLYRQDYCGCLFGLSMQREEQKKLADELFSPISKQVQAESIEARLELYTKRWELEEQNIPYKIVKERFLNWRQTLGHLKIKKETVPAHFLPYSTLKKNHSRGKIDYNIDNLYYMNRDEIKFITLEHYNRLTKSNYKSIIELIFNTPTLERELKLRRELISNPFDLSTIVVVIQIPTQKIEIVNISYVYEDIREVLYEI